jgi:FKBP-type peptidyl-prolyl cis-trans isomerase FklB
MVLALALALAACGRSDADKDASTSTPPPQQTVVDHTSALPPGLSVEANEKYLAESAAKAGTVVRPSGLQYRVLQSGTGKTPQYTDDKVEVTYKGWMIDGTVFDETPAGKTVTFEAGGVIAGWMEALSLMKEGDVWEVVIPADIAYGEEGKGPIPPNQTLVFQMKLVSVASADHDAPETAQ